MSDPPSRRPARPRVPYSDAVAQVICDRTEAGASLASICRRKGMPPRSTVEHWLKTRPEFTDAYAAALAAGGGRQSGGRPSAYSLETAVALCLKLGEGEALHRICAEPGMPSQSVVYRWTNRHPEFAALFRLARDIQAQRLFDEVREIADGATADTLQLARTRIAARQWQASKMAPRQLGEAQAGEDGAKGAFNVEVVKFARQDPNPQ
jgi:hypothetical protein